MNIFSFRIRNYRSIVDSGECFLSGDGITILAGMNEAGKTAILEALEDFSTEKTFRKESKPIVNSKSVQEVSVTFRLDGELIKELYNSIGIEYNKTSPDEIKLEIIKKGDPPQYFLTENGEKLLDVDYAIIYKQKQFEKIFAKTKSQHDVLSTKYVGKEFPPLSFDNIIEVKNRINEYYQHVKGLTFPAPPPFNQSEYNNSIQQLIKEFQKYDGDRSSISKKLLESIKQYIPNFILFSSFEDTFPSEIKLEEARNNELVKDMVIISNLNLDTIVSGSPEDKIKHKDKINIKLKEEYKKYWNQDLTNLHVEWDSKSLFFYVKDGENYFPPKLRSKGKQWHIAFYIKVSARARENVLNIILIDEPGLFLHAKAQLDILKQLEESAKEAPIIFSTHSPYLIDINHLHRIRLVNKTSTNGTIISNKIHKEADKETLTPIITAIGLDLSQGLDIAKENNIIVEGMSDYYYLIALKEKLKTKFPKETHIIPCTGANKVSLLITLMIGWNLNYCVILDNDKKGKETRKIIENNFPQVNTPIIMVSDSEGNEIEDLFSREDFAKYILDQDSASLPVDRANSKILKEQKLDKVLLSKLFLEKSNKDELTLSTETKFNFEVLFNKIRDSLF